MLIFTSDKKRLIEHFRKEPALFAYHIGDLDDFHFQHCQWGATYGKSPRIDDCILVYNGLKTPTVLAFGLTEKFQRLLETFIPLFPKKFHCHYQEPSRELLCGLMKGTDLGSHYKMALQEFTPHDDAIEGVEFLTLDESHLDDLLKLYTEAFPDNYFMPRMLESGKYLAAKCDGRMVAVAGVHVDSDDYKVAALGNITTHPEYRGRGIATLLTSRLTGQLVAEGKLVCLNVDRENPAAIHCYEKLGFAIVHEYLEATFELQ